jgi:hypothetical protein
MVYHLQIPSLKNLLYIVVAVILFSTISSAAAMERENRGKEMSPPSYMKRNDDTFLQEKSVPQKLSYYYPSTSSLSNFQKPQQQRQHQAYFGRQSLSLSDLFRLNEFPNYG